MREELITDLIRAYIENGPYNNVDWAARLRNPPGLTPKEVELWVNTYIDNWDKYGSDSTYGLTTALNLRAVKGFKKGEVKRFLEKNPRCTTIIGILRGSSESVVDEAIESFIDQRDVETVLTVARELQHPLRGEQILRLERACIQNGEHDAVLRILEAYTFFSPAYKEIAQKVMALAAQEMQEALNVATSALIDAYPRGTFDEERKLLTLIRQLDPEPREKGLTALIKKLIDHQSLGWAMDVSRSRQNPGLRDEEIQRLTTLVSQAGPIKQPFPRGMP